MMLYSQTSQTVDRNIVQATRAKYVHRLEWEFPRIKSLAPIYDPKLEDHV